MSLFSLFPGHSSSFISRIPSCNDAFGNLEEKETALVLLERGHSLQTRSQDILLSRCHYTYLFYFLETNFTPNPNMPPQTATTITHYTLHTTTTPFFTPNPATTTHLSTHTHLEDANYMAVKHFENVLGQLKVDELGIWDEAAIRLAMDFTVLVEGKEGEGSVRVWVEEVAVEDGSWE